jgi:hypothetical protein
MTSQTSVVDAENDSEVQEPAETAAVADTADRTQRSSRMGALAARGREARESSIKVETLVVAVVVLALVVLVAVVGWQLHAKSNDLDAVHRQASDRANAERVALEYAMGAAEMDFHDLAAWRGRLTKGTTPELANRLGQAAMSMEQIISPLQWTSSSKPIAAKVRSEQNGAYSVDCFVNVITKNSQAPDGINSTATYRLTIDSNHNWVITDIAGIDSALAPK